MTLDGVLVGNLTGRVINSSDARVAARSGRDTSQFEMPAATNINKLIRGKNE